MKKNVGNVDRWVRIVLGVVLLTLIVFIQSDWRWLGLIGLVPLITELTNFCPLYTLFGINTNHKKADEK